MSIRRLASSEVREKLAEIPDWVLAGDSLERQFRFDDFVEAFAFMTRVSGVAEALDHHPDWSNVYSLVVIKVTTHDVSGISERDFEFAKRVDQLVSDP